MKMKYRALAFAATALVLGHARHTWRDRPCNDVTLRKRLLEIVRNHAADFLRL